MTITDLITNLISISIGIAALWIATRRPTSKHQHKEDE